MKIYIQADNMFAVSCGEAILCEGDMEYCKGKIRQMVGDFDWMITGVEDGDVKKKFFFKLDVAETANKDIAQKNRMDFKGFLDMLRSASKCEIIIDAGFHGFG